MLWRHLSKARCLWYITILFCSRWGNKELPQLEQRSGVSNSTEIVLRLLRRFTQRKLFFDISWQISTKFELNSKRLRIYIPLCCSRLQSKFEIRNFLSVLENLGYQIRSYSHYLPTYIFLHNSQEYPKLETWLLLQKTYPSIIYRFTKWTFCHKMVNYFSKQQVFGQISTFFSRRAHENHRDNKKKRLEQGFSSHRFHRFDEK